MLHGLVAPVALWGRSPARMKKISTIVTLSAAMLVKTVIADLLWEMEFLQGRWTTAFRDWQTLNHGTMHNRLQDELHSLRCRAQHVEEIAQSLATTGGEAMTLSLLQALCRAVLTQGDPCSLGSLA